MKKDFYDVNDAGKTFIWAVLTPQILGTLIYMIFLGVSSYSGETINEILSKTVNVYILLMLTQFAFALVFFIYNRKINYVKACKFNKLSGENIFLCIIIAIIVLIGLTPISNISVQLMEQAGLEFSTALPIGLNSIGDLFLAIVLVAFVPAVLEELIFRGMILQGLRKFGSWPAILISAGLFALMHASAIQLVYTFLFGIVLALVVIKTGSILSSMICHFTANGLSLVLSYINVGGEELGVATVSDFFIAIIIAVLTFSIVFSLVKKMKNNDKHHSKYLIIMKELEAKGITGIDITESELIELENTNRLTKGEDELKTDAKIQPESLSDEVLKETFLAKLKQFKTQHKPNNSTMALKIGIAIGIAIWCISFSTYFI